MIKLKLGDVFKHVGITLYCYRRLRKLIEGYKLLSCRIVLVIMHLEGFKFDTPNSERTVKEIMDALEKYVVG